MEVAPVLDFTYKHSVNSVMHPPLHIFNFYARKNEKQIGKLVCHKSEIPIRPNYDSSVLAIDFLEVTDKNIGIGTKILKFAEEYSRQIGCKGFMTLKSDTTYMPERIPHIFYRKFGFSTFNKSTDKQLDKFINHNRNATKKDFPCLLMHYPASDIKNVKLNVKLKNLLKYIIQKIWQ